MRIGKPLLLVTTPLGIGLGLVEAYRIAGGLLLLMVALLGMMAAAFAQVVLVIRREQAEARRASGEEPGDRDG